MVWYGMVWYGMVWYGMVWYGMVWYGMVRYDMVRYGIIWYGTVWDCMVWTLSNRTRVFGDKRRGTIVDYLVTQDKAYPWGEREHCEDKHLTSYVPSPWLPRTPPWRGWIAGALPCARLRCPPRSTFGEPLPLRAVSASWQRCRGTPEAYRGRLPVVGWLVVWLVVWLVRW